MGFTRESIQKESEKYFQKAVIEDGPNGPINLVSIFKLPASMQEMVRERQKRLIAIEDDDNATVEDLHEALTSILELVSSSHEDLKEYVSDFATADLLTLYSMWGEQTQPHKSAPNS